MDNRAAVTAARADARAKVADENAKMPPLVAFMRGVEKVIRAEFGGDPKALAAFDLEPLKARTPMTAEEKAVAVAIDKTPRGPASGRRADPRRFSLGFELRDDHMHCAPHMPM